MWTFLNQSFTIFVLSSVVLAGLTGLYSHIQVVNQNAQTVQSLDFEIATRLRSLKQMVGDQKRDMSVDNLLRVYDVFNGSTSDIFVHRPTLASFNDRNLADLMSQRLGLTSKSDGSVAQMSSEVDYAQHFSDVLSNALFKAHNLTPDCRIDAAILVKDRSCIIPGDAPRQSELYEAILRDKLTWAMAESIPKTKLNSPL